MSAKFRILTIAAAAVVFGALFAPSVSYAAGGASYEVSQAETSNESAAIESYNYIVTAGDSLSIIVRDALSRYSQTKKLDLSPAARIYCETKIVQQLGERLLEVGEQVSVPLSALKECADSSKSLSEQQLAAWNTYANQADFSSSTVAPTNPDVANQSDDDSQNQDENSKNQDQSEKDETQDEEQSAANSDTIAWYWWVLALTIVGVVFYLLRDRPTSEPAAPAKKATSSKRGGRSKK